jgi:hypothetical protein
MEGECTRSGRIAPLSWHGGGCRVGPVAEGAQVAVSLPGVLRQRRGAMDDLRRERSKNDRRAAGPMPSAGMPPVCRRHVSGGWQPS